MHTLCEYQKTLSSSAAIPCVSASALLYWLETSNAVKNRRGEHSCPQLVDSPDSDILAFHRQDEIYHQLLWASTGKSRQALLTPVHWAFLTDRC